MDEEIEKAAENEGKRMDSKFWALGFISGAKKCNDERIERLANQVHLQGEQINGIMQILKTEWKAKNEIDLVKYTEAEIESMWKVFKRRFGL